jgi:hypothetical protein
MMLICSMVEGEYSPYEHLVAQQDDITLEEMIRYEDSIETE